MELRVNDYVRTHDGRIDKIVNIKNDFIYIENSDYGYRENYLKSSPNIIDLIEAGDIVNYGLLGGGMVIFKKDGEITTNTILFSNLKEKDIKKVITKEQIENLEYEVE